MGVLEDGVRELILDSYKSLAAFARDIDLPEHTLYSALNNGLPGATLTTVMPIAKALNLDPADLAQGRLTVLDASPKPALVPVCSLISAGKSAEPVMSDLLLPIPAALHDAFPDAYMLRVGDNSMNRVIGNGFYALVDPCAGADVSGRLYVVQVGDGPATVKRVVLHDNGLTLEPDSYDPTYRSVLFDYGDPEAAPVAVIGRVVWYCPPVDWADLA